MREYLDAHPELATATIHTAAAVGEVATARELLAADPSLASREGGPYTAGRRCNGRFVDPITTWCPTSVASPSGIAVVGDRVYVACLRGQRLYRVGLDGRNGDDRILRVTP